MATNPVGAAHSGALTGLRVLEFSQVWAGPACGEVLGDFGADVIKIESASRPDIARTMGPFPGGFDLNSSGYFLEWNRNKRSVELDLKNPEDVETALALAVGADVVLENYAPGVLDRLDVGYAQIAARNPAVVMLSLTGYGATGPDGQTVAYGQQIEAESGLMAITGYEAGPPLKPGTAFPDYVSAIGGVVEIMAALHRRKRTGEGCWIDFSMLEMTVTMMSEPMSAYRSSGVTPSRIGNRSTLFAPHGIYACAGQDQWVALECHDDEAWLALAHELGGQELADDPRFRVPQARLANVELVDELVSSWTAHRNAEEVADLLQHAGIPAATVTDIAGLFNDPHLADRGYWVDFEYPGVGHFRAHGPIARMDVTPARVNRLPPRLGEHSAEVLLEAGRERTA